MKICEYGCGQEAKYQFKNGKWCCSKNFRSCNFKKKELSTKLTGRIVWNKNIKNCFSDETIEKIKKSKVGKKRNPFSNEWKKNIGLKSKHKQTKDTIEKIRNSNLGKKRTKEQKDNISNSKKGKHLSETHKMNISYATKGNCKPELREKRRQRLLNGDALKMIRAIKKISTEEIKLRNFVKELYPDCEFQYPVFRYSLDVALIEEKIAIEYDGYYHFCSEENKIYHKERQERIESRGWKFYRVSMYDKFPSLLEIKENIENLIKGNK